MHCAPLLLFATLFTCSYAFRGHPGRYFSMHLSEPVAPVVERKNAVWNDNNYVSKRELNKKYNAFLETLLRAVLYEKMVARKRRLPVLQQKQQRDGASYEQVLLGNLYL